MPGTTDSHRSRSTRPEDDGYLVLIAHDGVEHVRDTEYSIHRNQVISLRLISDQGYKAVAYQS